MVLLNTPTRRKKILYIITKGYWGGAQRYVFDLATNLPKERFDLVVTMGEGTALEHALLTAGVRTVRLTRLAETRRTRLTGSDWGAFMEILRLLQKERPDIVHLNSSRAALLGALAFRCFQLLNFLTAKSYKLKAVFTAHGWPFKEPRPFLARLGVLLASFLTALLADWTITLSTDDYRQGRAMPFVRRKISLIYNGIREGDFFSRKEAREKLFGVHDDSLWIGTIAELTFNKGIATLIEALPRIQTGVRLCVIGGGEDREKLESLARLRGVDGRVLFTGALEGASAYLSAFDIFALPSLKEGLPYTLLEAGRQQLPVVASDISGVRDIIDTPLAGVLVPAGNADALAEALKSLLAQKETREALGNALNARVTTAFSFDKMRSETLALYEQLSLSSDRV